MRLQELAQLARVEGLEVGGEDRVVLGVEAQPRVDAHRAAARVDQWPARIAVTDLRRVDQRADAGRGLDLPRGENTLREVGFGKGVRRCAFDGLQYGAGIARGRHGIEPLRRDADLQSHRSGFGFDLQHGEILRAARFSCTDRDDPGGLEAAEGLVADAHLAEIADDVMVCDDGAVRHEEAAAEAVTCQDQHRGAVEQAGQRAGRGGPARPGRGQDHGGEGRRRRQQGGFDRGAARRGARRRGSARRCGGLTQAHQLVAKGLVGLPLGLESGGVVLACAGDGVT